MDPHAIATIHSGLLATSFPPDELIPLDVLLDRVESGRATVRVVGEPSDPLAVAIVERLEGTPAVLLEYFATRADQRGRGVGTALLRELLATISTDSAVSVVLAEVEHPDFHEADDAHGDPAARLRFYGRLGARILGVPYFQAPVSDDANPVFGMLLLVLAPAQRWVRDDHLVPEAGVGQALRMLLGGADPTLATPIVEGASGPIRLFDVDELAFVPVTRDGAARRAEDGGDEGQGLSARSSS